MIKCRCGHSNQSVIKQVERSLEVFVSETVFFPLLQGHVGSSAYGVSLLEDENMVPELIRLAEECGVFSIRGYVFVFVFCTLCCPSGNFSHGKFGSLSATVALPNPN